MPSQSGTTTSPQELRANADSLSYRPYRSKRLRPCDSCRRRKTACRIDSQPPCVGCRVQHVECRFEGPPAKRRRGPMAERTPEEADEPPMAQDSNVSPPLSINDDAPRQNASMSTEHLVLNDPTWPSHNLNDLTDYHSLLPNFSSPTQQLDAWSTNPAAPADLLSHDERISLAWQDFHIHEQAAGFVDSIQSPISISTPSSTVKSLDKLEGFTAQYFGLSGETDPYLIRHFNFSPEGEARFFKVHFRQVAPEGNGIMLDGVPAHFMISSDELGIAMKKEASFFDDSLEVNDIDTIVNPLDGRRLVHLFLRFVFPSLPIISRTQLGMTSESQLSTTIDLSQVPHHLLAAIYAISLPYSDHDPVLCVSNVYRKPAIDNLWKVTLQGIMREIHMPKLSVLQAILIYLHKPPSDQTSAMADSPFGWSLMGFAHSLSSTLGLHLECRQWSVPDWEKRLRRRLWWAVFSETTWRSLLLGFPSPISDDNWDVAPLDHLDFLIETHNPDPGSDALATMLGSADAALVGFNQSSFTYLVNLALIASDIHSSFYTLKPSKKLARNLDLSLQAARPFRARLSDWYSSLPEEYRSINLSSRDMTTKRAQGLRTTAHLQLYYLTLELLLYRALLRPTGNVVPKQAGPFSVVQQQQDGDIRGSALEASQAHPAIDNILGAAVDCARLMITYTAELTSGDLNSFWFSWSRICFSTMSNFAVTLLIQAPSLSRAQEAKKIVEDWRDTLRLHSQNFSLVRLGLLRLNAMLWVGLGQLSRASQSAEHIIRGTKGNKDN